MWISNMFGKPIDDMLKEFYKEHKLLLLGSIGTSITTYTIESIVLPKVMAHLLTNVSDKVQLRNNLIKVLASWAAIQSSYALNEIINSNIEPLLTKYITDRLIHAVFVKYEHTHKEIDTSIIFSKILSLRTNIESLVDRIFIVLLPRVIGIGLIVLNFYSINKKIGTCTLIVILLQILLIFKDINNCIDISFDEMEGKDAAMEEISDKFSNIHTISSIKHGMEKEIKNCEKISGDSMNSKMKANKCVIGKQVLGYMSNTAVFSVILIYTYKLYVDNEINSEQLATVLFSMNTLFNQMYEITYYIPDITRKLGVLESNHKFATELFNYEDKSSECKVVVIPNGSIKFENVAFGYEKNHIFKNLNISINNAKIVALYGPSGSGKTTFIKLILNILKPNKGTILIGGIPTGELSNNCIKHHISYVSQNTSTLFNKTIYENLTYGYDDVDIKEKLIDLFDKYDLCDIFININKGLNKDRFAFFDYKVGKVGELLSGGQRQIIHIIRTILNRNSIINIFDEPTTALDTKNKHSVLRLIKHEMDGKTRLIITHDNDVNKICDRVIDFNSHI